MGMSMVKAFATIQRLGALLGSTSAGTFGTAVTQTLPTWARGILGLVVTGAQATLTAAQGSSGKLRVNIKSLGVANEEFSVGPYYTSGPATNEGAYPSVAEIIPLDLKCGGGEAFTVDMDVCGSATGAATYEVGIMLSNNPAGLPSDWKLKFPSVVPLRGGKVENAAQLTVTRTPLTAIKIPSYVEAIVGYKALITKTGAITAGEVGIGYFDIANTLGITPIELISCFNTSGTIGTPVDNPSSTSHVPYIPIYIPVGGREETFTPNIVLTSAVSTGNRVAIALAWR